MPPPTLPPKPPKPPAGKPPLVKPAAKPQAPARAAKTFSIETWQGGNEGRKSVLYGMSGVGKTTLASTAPNPVFIAFDDGGRKINNPVTGEALRSIPGVESFEDLRDALHQTSLWEAGTTCVLDNTTKLQAVVEPYLFANYLVSGKRVTNMRGFGWDGPAHMLDVYRLLMTDLDAIVRRGVNVILLAQLGQATVANAAGADYLQDGPNLVHNKQYSVRNELCEWADDVLRIGYQDFAVVKDDAKAKAGKVASSDATRAVFTGGAQHFLAKSRPVNGYRIPDVVSFADPTDRSIWQYIFEGAKAE